MSLDESLLSDPEVARRISRAMSIAFANTEGKKYPDDRFPCFSIYVIERVMAVATDSGLRSTLGEVIVKLKDKAAQIRSGSSGEEE